MRSFAGFRSLAITLAAALLIACGRSSPEPAPATENPVERRGEEARVRLQADSVELRYFDARGRLVLRSTPNLFPSGPTAAFCVQAGFVSSDAYAFLLDNDELARWRMGSDRADAWRISMAAPEPRLLVVPGDVQTATRKFSAINGRHRVPPVWALGPVLSRPVQTLGLGAGNAASYEAKVGADLARLEDRNLPIRGYAFEGREILSREVVREVSRRPF